MPEYKTECAGFIEALIDYTQTLEEKINVVAKGTEDLVHVIAEHMPAPKADSDIGLKTSAFCIMPAALKASLELRSTMESLHEARERLLDYSLAVMPEEVKEQAIKAMTEARQEKGEAKD